LPLDFLNLFFSSVQTTVLNIPFHQSMWLFTGSFAKVSHKLSLPVHSGFRKQRLAGDTAAALQMYKKVWNGMFPNGKNLSGTSGSYTFFNSSN